MSNIETGGGNWYMPLDSASYNCYHSLQSTSKVSDGSFESTNNLCHSADVDNQDTHSATSTSLSPLGRPSQQREKQRGIESRASSSDLTHSFESRAQTGSGMVQAEAGAQVSFQKGRRKPGRPPSLFVDKSDSELTEEERKVKAKIIKRRLRQNRSYQRRKLRRQFEVSLNSSISSAGAVGYGATVSSPSQYRQASESGLYGFGGSAGFERETLTDRKFLERRNPTVSGEVLGQSQFCANLENFENSAYSTMPHSVRERELSSGRSPEKTNAYRLQPMPSTVVEHSSQLPNVEPLLSRDLASMYLEKLFKSLTPVLRRTLFKLSVFPETFDYAAAKAVIQDPCFETGSEEEMLGTLNERGFIVKVSPKRFQLDLLSKQFILREVNTQDNFNDWEIIQVAKKHFVNYYTDLLKLVDNERMILDGTNMEQVLGICDLERMNFEMCLSFAQELGSKTLRHALIAGSNILRHFIPASERVSLILSILDVTRYEDSLSFHNHSKCKNIPSHKDGDISLSSHPTVENLQEDALLLISLGEAYSDDLLFKEAEQVLCKSLWLLEQSGMTNKPCALIPLIILSNILRETDRTEEALNVLRGALKKLSEFHLEDSSYAISVYENMALTLLIRNEREEARHFLSNVLKVAESIRFEGLPLYTDILGTCGVFSLVFKDVEVAESYFKRALENYGGFISRPWSRAPIESCRDLDLWILDNLSKALMLLDKTSDASIIQEQIEMIARIRGIKVCSVDSFESNDEEFGTFPSSESKFQLPLCYGNSQIPSQFANPSVEDPSNIKSKSELRSPGNSEPECLFLDDATMILYHRVFIRHLY